jgi:hypothetical protein
MALLTPDQETAILDSVARGTPPRQAFLANGVSDDTLREWQRIATSPAETSWRTGNPVSEETRAAITSFTDRLTQAQAGTFQVLTGALYANATTINPKTGHSDTQAADKLLSKHPAYRRDWFEYREQHTTTDNHTLVELRHQVDALPLADARALLDALPDPQG